MLNQLNHVSMLRMSYGVSSRSKNHMFNLYQSGFTAAISSTVSDCFN